MSATAAHEPLEQITPIVLTFNEEANLARTLDSLRWAKAVLVVDSGSTDGTLAIAASYPGVTIVHHPFRDFGEQWAFALAHPVVQTTYVLALDADMAVGPGLVEEMAGRVVAHRQPGARIRFKYMVGGRPLWGSLYPADVRLFDRTRVRVAQRGHAHHFEVDGGAVALRARLIHDDRKPIDRFVASQMAYAAREHARIQRGEGLRFRDRLRRWGLMAPAVFLLAYVRAGGPFKGRAALRYAHERAFYETLLALRLLGDDEPPPPPPAPPGSRT